MAFWTEEGRCSECDRRGCICPPGEGMNRAATLSMADVQNIVRARSIDAKAYVYGDGQYSIACQDCGWHHGAKIPDTLAGITPHMGEWSAANYILNIFNSHTCTRGAKQTIVETPHYYCGTQGCRDTTHHTAVCWAQAEPTRCKTCGHPNGVVGNGFCGCKVTTMPLSKPVLETTLHALSGQYPDYEFSVRPIEDIRATEFRIACRKCKVRVAERRHDFDIQSSASQISMTHATFHRLMKRCMCHRGADIKLAMEKLNLITKIAVLAWADHVVDDSMRRFALLELR